MKLLSILSIVFFCVSCTVVSFNKPQPKNGIRLSEFPKELQGTWNNHQGEYLSIKSDRIIESSVNRDSLEVIIDTTHHTTFLTDSIQLFKAGKYFTYNEQNNKGTWYFALLEVDKKGNVNCYMNDDYKFYAKLRGLSVDSVLVQVQEYIEEIDELVTIDSTIYTPSKKDLLKLDQQIVEVDNITFNGQIRIKDLKKIANKKNLRVIYKSDGTIESIEQNSEFEDENEEVN